MQTAKQVVGRTDITYDVRNNNTGHTKKGTEYVILVWGYVVPIRQVRRTEIPYGVRNMTLQSTKKRYDIRRLIIAYCINRLG